ncbi:hypothetical protein [Streptomyces sp. AMCC400023]|uniref:hypothetical protein n=1 Tax=Streptomyces sp. AMCC400023 TaxID=2056258 RepID=UPI001F3A992D|nr:hypothetical protein [Streptomyces sp. AMCC400023]
MASQAVSDKISGSTVMLVVGFIADVTAAAFFLISSDTRAWLRDHYFSITIGALILVAAVLALLNSLLTYRDRITDLQGQISALEAQLAMATEHDAEMFKTINEHVSPQSDIVIWLREGFLVTRAPSEHVHALERMVKFYEREPRGFDDQNVEVAYRALIDTARKLVDKISEHMWYEGEGSSWLSIPREWDHLQPQRRDKAMVEISESRDNFIDSYDSFFLVVQQKRMTSAIGLSAPRA